MDEEPETVHKNEKKRKVLSRQRLQKENPEKVKEDQRKWDFKRNHVNSENRRLKKFRERTMFNAIFTCSCCQRNLFDCNVNKIDDKLIMAIRMLFFVLKGPQWT